MIEAWFEAIASERRGGEEGKEALGMDLDREDPFHHVAGV